MSIVLTLYRCFGHGLKMFWSWSEDVLDIISRLFLLLFSQVETFRHLLLLK